MSTTKVEPAEESKQEESMQQKPTAPPEPMGPPPTYSEAINSRPYPASTPYPVTDSSMPLPVTQTPSAPYPVEASSMPTADSSAAAPRPMGFYNASQASNRDRQPIVDQPSPNNEYAHPKTTYVVLQDERRRRDDDECSCTDWLMCCWCCVESCRCMLLCLECASACK